MNLRLILALTFGLFIGAAGVTLFHDSLPATEGSVEEKVTKLESELTRAKSRMAKLEAQIPQTAPDLAATARGGMADILEDMKEGRPVDLDRLYERMKPALREIAPLFDLLRRREQKKEFARIASHMGEAYHLNEAQQKALQQWMEERAIEDAEKFNQIAYGDGSKLEDIIKAAKFQRPKKGLDSFMESTLKGSELQRYKADRLVERNQQIETDANNRVNRLNQAVQLDENQQDRVFSIMARSSPDFDPSTKLSIPLGNDVSSIKPGQDREQAIRGVLRPDQLRQYESYRQTQIQNAQRDAAEMGFKLPANWDLFENQ